MAEDFVLFLRRWQALIAAAVGLLFTVFAGFLIYKGNQIWATKDELKLEHEYAKEMYAPKADLVLNSKLDESRMIERQRNEREMSEKLDRMYELLLRLDDKVERIRE